MDVSVKSAGQRLPGQQRRVLRPAQQSDQTAGQQQAKQHAEQQMSLFGAPIPAPAVTERSNQRLIVNPHLLAARRLARQIRRLPEHSPEETRTGLAICRQLKAYLQDDAPSRH